jgi:hypothetical protein
MVAMPTNNFVIILLQLLMLFTGYDLILALSTGRGWIEVGVVCRRRLGYYVVLGGLVPPYHLNILEPHPSGLVVLTPSPTGKATIRSNNQ